MLAASFLESSNFNLAETIVAIGFSLIASVAVYLIYHLFYGSRNIGAGVDRSFIIAGPAITALFLGIQSSIPLSLGLLGALSFVRFRTPVKDPAEIGYLLLLIATSIGAATRNYLITIILFLIVFVTLSIQWLVRNRFSFRDRASFMITVDKTVFSDIEPKLTQFLESHLNNLTLKTMSVLDDRVSIHYQHREISASDKMKFTTELTKLAEPGNVEFFAG
ncbi:MAG: DUF4956 domain-containing protein [Planctomycetaceae bacterium]|nr:MAG: DUF4956 domain-containing protein [Planctomycetaceae bacterium]